MLTALEYVVAYCFVAFAVGVWRAWQHPDDDPYSGESVAAVTLWPGTIFLAALWVFVSGSAWVGRKLKSATSDS